LAKFTASRGASSGRTLSEDSDIIRLRGEAGGGAMNEPIIDNTKEKILTYEISDAALEIAAGIGKAGTVSLTVAFCSGLDYCQPKSPHAFGAPGRPTLAALTQPRI